jgi:hypothetical protein
MFILDPDLCPPRDRNNKIEKEEKIICHTFFVAINFTKFEFLFIFNRYRTEKNLSQLIKIKVFFTQILLLSF